MGPPIAGGRAARRPVPGGLHGFSTLEPALFHRSDRSPIAGRVVTGSDIVTVPGGNRFPNDPGPDETGRHADPRPTHDPAPEPTPWLGKVSGSFGSTLTVGGVTAYLEPRAPSSDPRCVSGDPSMRDYTEIVSYDLRMTWPASAEVIQPFLAVGASPYFNANWFDPSGFESGVTYVVSTCVRLGDSDEALIERESNGGPPRSYRFSFS